MADDRSIDRSVVGRPHCPNSARTLHTTHGICMRPHRVSLSWLVLALWPATAPAQESYKIEAHKEAPPSTLSAAVRDTLAGEGYRVVDGEGKTFAEIWLRKAVLASEKPAGPQGAIQFPALGAPF